MILESLDEIRAQGVRVHNCRNITTPFDVGHFTVPGLAQWVAMDADGEVKAYERQPRQFVNCWLSTGGNVRSLGYVGTTGIDWQQTLTPVNVATAAPVAQPDRIAHAVSILAGATESEIATFARLFVAANAITADITINALCDAYRDERCANVVDSIIAAVMAATDTQRAALATALAQRDPHMADALATALDNALYDSQAQQRDAEAASIAADDALLDAVAPLDDDDDDDCRCLLAAAQ